MISNYLIILSILLLTIIIILFLNYFLKQKYNQNFIENYSNLNINNYNENHNDNHNENHNENHYNQIIDNDKIDDYNLITNGDFKNGQNCKNHVTQSGYNKIIIMKNPSSSSFVLEQKNTANLTYYELLCDNDKNNKYNLFFWLSIEDNSIQELNFEKLIHVKIQNEDFSTYIPRFTYNIIQRVFISSNDKNPWYLLKFEFISGPNTINKMQIFLNYSENLQYPTFYFTKLSLYKVLLEAQNFIFNHNLFAYFDGYHYESSSPIWTDLSGNGNDIFWSNIPITDYTKGSLNTLNLNLTCFQANKLSNEKMSIIFCLNKNFENIASNIAINEENSNFDFYLLSIPGNDRYSFEIKIIDNYLFLINGKLEFKSKHEVILFNKSLITLTYNESILEIIHDGIIIISEKINKLYFSPNNIIINKNKNLNFNFYSILFYNRIIKKNELNQIREYFITNKNKNFNTPDINIHHMNNTSEYTLNIINNTLPLYEPFNFTQKDNFTNKNDNLFDNCIKDCSNLCNQFIDNNVKYNDCISNCKNVLLSCQNYCDTNPNDNLYCTPIIKNNTCPKVYKKNGKYMVYIHPESEYAKILNYSGEKSYGTNLEKAKNTYNINFPKCPIPDQLLPGEGKNYYEFCPYIINELNPCYTSACAGVNWNNGNYKNLNINKNCKKAISNYCQINYPLDDSCKCWNPEMSNDKNCSEFRRFFEDPNDYCSPGQFNIEEHPDFDKYIKKDNIPCWGCKL
jgi:hypothetical protein